MAWKDAGGSALGSSRGTSAGRSAANVGGFSPSGGSMRVTTSRRPSYVHDEEVGASNIVSPKGSVKKVKGVTQVRRGSARERLIAKNAKKKAADKILNTAQPGSDDWLSAFQSRYPGM